MRKRNFICVALALAASCSDDEVEVPAGLPPGAQEPACEGCPLTPTDLQLTPGPGRKVTVEFKDNSDNEDAFVLERKTADAGFIPLQEAPAETRCLLTDPQRESPCFVDQDPALRSGVRFAYRVRAYRDSLSSNYSPEASLTIP